MTEDTLIRKVLDLTDVEAFECHGKLVSTFPLSCVQVTNPVPVYGGTQRIGFATIDPKTLETSVFLVKECPERLDIENGGEVFIETEETIRAYDSCDAPLLKWVQVNSVALKAISMLPAGSPLPPTVTRGSF